MALTTKNGSETSPTDTALSTEDKENLASVEKAGANDTKEDLKDSSHSSASEATETATTAKKSAARKPRASTSTAAKTTARKPSSRTTTAASKSKAAAAATPAVKEAEEKGVQGEVTPILKDPPKNKPLRKKKPVIKEEIYPASENLNNLSAHDSNWERSRRAKHGTWQQVDLRCLELMSDQYPNRVAVFSEIINLQAILNLPKGTEHFVSDIHGEYEAFCHILNNCSGVIRDKVQELFKMSKSQCDNFCTLIYYPHEVMGNLEERGLLTPAWFKDNLYHLIQLCRYLSAKYTRSKVRKAINQDYSYIIDELLHAQEGESDSRAIYHSKIIDTILKTKAGTHFVVSLCALSKRLAVDHLHVVGDIWDRGPHPDRVMRLLMDYHSLDIQWGNHDLLWMGAACGSDVCIATALRNNINYSNCGLLEGAYGISLRHLDAFAHKTYRNVAKKNLVIKHDDTANHDAPAYRGPDTIIATDPQWQAFKAWESSQAEKVDRKLKKKAKKAEKAARRYRESLYEVSYDYRMPPVENTVVPKNYSSSNASSFMSERDFAWSSESKNQLAMPIAVSDDDDDTPEDRKARMVRALTIISLKLQGQLIKRNPEFDMDDRLLLDKMDLKKGTVMIEGKEYQLNSTEFPTLDPEHPYELSEEEAHLMADLKNSFLESRELQREIRFIMSHGSIYKCFNGNLLFHGCVPMTEDGEFRAINCHGRMLKGREYMDYCDRTVRHGYDVRDTRSLDFMYFLWCALNSPLSGRTMKPFERYFVEDKSTHVEPRDPYYQNYFSEDICRKILEEFDLDPDSGHIVNGHTPIRVKEGESPIRGNGKLFVIDGGLCQAYHKTTGIAGYTLIFSSHGMGLRAHKPFDSTARAIAEKIDIFSTSYEVEHYTSRILVADSDTGVRIRRNIFELEALLDAYRLGRLPERATPLRRC